VTYLAAFGRFWYGFIIGDDWRIAAGVAAALALTFWLAHAGFNVWWLLPLAAIALLAASVTREAVRHRAARRRSSRGSPRTTAAP
jgi:hypothetical protein